MCKRLLTLLGCALLLAVLPAGADQWNKRTTVTFTRPVELPGVVLPAGTYVFKLANSNSNRHIVQVFNAEENKIFATILAIPNYRLTPTDKVVMPFEERAPGNAEAMRAWFHPGDNFGQEFVYPKARAAEIAEATHELVLSGEVKPTETPQELIQEPVVAVTPEKQEVEIAKEVQPAPLVAQAEPAPAPEPAIPAELPKTAGLSPAVLMAGLIALTLAGALKLVRRIS
jgi:hypothetical protein